MASAQKVDEGFTVLDKPNEMHLDGHTEILQVFKRFKALYPAASRYETRLDPAPWNELYAQKFKHVPNDRINELLVHWKKQLNCFLAQRGPELVRAAKKRELLEGERAELDDIKKSCPHHDSSAENFRTNGENCEVCGEFIR